MNIYEFFNSRDIAEHCRNIGYKLTAIETAYIIWRSNHHTLEEKHEAWCEIIATMPDEQFRPNWDFDDHTLHSFLRTYMRLQNEFIEEFRTTKSGYIYSYGTRKRFDDRYHLDDIFFDSYEVCLNALKVNELDDDTDDEIVGAMIVRKKLYSSHVSFRDAQEEESITFDKKLHPIAIDSVCNLEDDSKFLSYAYGFYEMWIAIPTPFRKGDIVMDVDTYVDYSNRHLPFVLESLPYWQKGADNGENCDAEVERLLNLGVDWTDMQEGIYLQDDNGELYWDHAFHYLDLEYYREDLQGTETFLRAVSHALQGKINMEELLKSHSAILMGNYASEMFKYWGDNHELMYLCGVESTQTTGQRK